MRNRLLVLGGVVVTALAIAVQHIWDLDKNAWASLAQAFGSVAAVFAAIWLAFRETARRNAEALDRARITATALELRLSVDIDLGIRLDRLEASHPVGEHPLSVLLEIRECLESLKLASTEEQLAMVPLPNGIAIELAQATGRVHLAINQVNKLLSDQFRDREGDRNMMGIIMQAQIRGICDCLQNAVRECHAASSPLLKR